MRKQTPLSGEIDRLMNEIHVEEDAVPLSPWTLTLEELMNWNKEESDWDRGKRNYGAIELWDAYTPKKLNEASLGHMYWNYLESKAKSFAIIADYSKVEIKKNKQKAKYLIHQINRDNYFGLWGHSQKDGPDNDKIHVVEPYWFLVGIPLNRIRAFLNKFGEYSILYSGPETGEHVTNFENSGTTDDLGPFHPNRIAQFYSKPLGRPLVFETRISGWIAQYGALHHGIKEVAGIRKARKFISKTVRNYSF